MTSKSNKIRMAKAAIRKPTKKKPNVIDTDRVKFIDYKDINLLGRFMSDRSKIRGSRIAGTSLQQQREIASAVKNAREMALLPYSKKVSSARAPRSGSDRGRDRDRGDENEKVDKYAAAAGIEDAGTNDKTNNKVEAVELIGEEV